LLAKYKDSNTQGIDTNQSPDDWMKKLLSSEDSSVGMSTGDPIMGMMASMYMSLLALAVQIDNKSDEEKKNDISQSVSNRQVDLKSLLPAMKECTLTIGENGKATLSADNGTTKVSRELTSAELSRLSAVLSNSELSDEAKKIRVTGLVNTIILSQQASQNYNEAVSRQGEPATEHSKIAL
jgi:hypothetical protein